MLNFQYWVIYIKVVIILLKYILKLCISNQDINEHDFNFNFYNSMFSMNSSNTNN